MGEAVVVGGIVIEAAGNLVGLFAGFSALFGATSRASVLAATRRMRISSAEKRRQELVEDATLIGVGLGLVAGLIVLGLDLVFG